MKLEPFAWPTDGSLQSGELYTRYEEYVRLAEERIAPYAAQEILQF